MYPLKSNGSEEELLDLLELLLEEDMLELDELDLLLRLLLELE